MKYAVAVVGLADAWKDRRGKVAIPHLPHIFWKGKTMAKITLSITIKGESAEDIQAVGERDLNFLSHKERGFSLQRDC